MLSTLTRHSSGDEEHITKKKNKSSRFIIYFNPILVSVLCILYKMKFANIKIITNARLSDIYFAGLFVIIRYVQVASLFKTKFWHK